MNRLSLMLGFALCAATALSAAPIRYYTELSGPNENPPNGSPAIGEAFVTIDPVANTMEVRISFSGLLGNTTASHIHCCAAPPNNANVATPTPTFPGFPSGVTEGFYHRTFDMTLASSYRAGFLNGFGGSTALAESALFAGIDAGQAYVNIHTGIYGGGEIRGFLQPAPEPATLALCGLALGSLLLLRRRRV